MKTDLTIVARNLALLGVLLVMLACTGSVLWLLSLQPSDAEVEAPGVRRTRPATQPVTLTGSGGAPAAEQARTAAAPTVDEPIPYPDRELRFVPPAASFQAPPGFRQHPPGEFET